MIKSNWTISIVRFDSIALNESKHIINAANAENKKHFVYWAQRSSKWPHQTTCPISGAIKRPNSLQAATLYFRRIYCLVFFPSLFSDYFVQWAQHKPQSFFTSQKERGDTKIAHCVISRVVELRFAGNKGGWYGNGLNGHFLPDILAIFNINRKHHFALTFLT